MKIDLLFLNCNRLHYTKLSLPALLSDPTEEFSLTIWDNGSTDGSREFISSVEDPRIVRKVLSQENVGVVRAINEVISKSSADLFGLIADDLLVTPGWTRPIAQAHNDVPEFGLIACWHLGPEDFDEARARHKIQRFGRHQVLRHPWTNGGVGLIKLKTLREAGPFTSAASSYWVKVALRGYVNGYYYPLIHAEHMDYPWSKHFPFSDRFEEWLQTSSGAKHHGLRSLEDAKAWHQVVMQVVLDGPWEAKYYSGWRRILKQGLQKIRNTLKL